MLEYKQEIPAMEDLLALYGSVGWTNYTNNPTMLEEAVKASLWQLAVYDDCSSYNCSNNLYHKWNKWEPYKRTNYIKGGVCISNLS